MTGFPVRFAAAADRLVGTPYRLHGRDPDKGVDCVGLVLCAIAAAGRQPAELPAYGLRNLGLDRLLPFAARNGFVEAPDAQKEGDLILINSGPAQHHLMIALDRSIYVHAHAGRREVVRQNGLQQASVVRHWRST